MSEPLGVAPGDTIADTIALMQRERKGCVIVRDGGRLCGIFTERDVLKKVLLQGASFDAPVESVMTADPDCVVTSDTLASVIRQMHAGGYRHLPVVDATDDVVGVISVKRVVQYLVEHFPEAVYNLPPDPNAISTAREGG